MISPSRRTIAMLRTNGGDHPCVLLTDPMKERGKGRSKVLLIPLSTSPNSRDTVCEFKESPDRRIPAGSYMYYAKAHIRETADLEAELRRRGRRLSKIAMVAHRRIGAGAKQPGAMPEKAAEFYAEAVRQGKAD